MRVLVTWGSKRGGTEGIGRLVADALAERGFEVTAAPAGEVKRASDFDAAIVGGALYANRWPAEARRFVRRNVEELREMPVWFFSSGPLDDSAERAEIPAPKEVSVLAERVGAHGYVTFGGYLAPDAKGMASAMAKEHAGDWRNPERIRAWAAELAAELPSATPGRAVDHPGRSIPRLVGYGALGWAVCAAILLGLAQVSATAALTAHVIAVPLVFALVSRSYFRARGARAPLPTAIGFTILFALLDLAVIGGVMGRGLGIFGSIAATWLPFALVFVTTWATGALMATMPWPKPEPRHA